MESRCSCSVQPLASRGSPGWWTVVNVMKHSLCSPWSSQKGNLTTCLGSNGGCLSLRKPSWVLEADDALIVNSAPLYMAPILDISVILDTSSSWMMQRASIHRYWIARPRHTLTASYSVGGSVSVGMLCDSASALALHSVRDCFPPQQ